MKCSNCGNTENWYTLEDGRTRCPACFATYETSKGGPLETHTHEETQHDEHTNEDGARVEQETTEKTEVEAPETDGSDA